MKHTISSHPEEKSGFSSLTWRQLTVRFLFAITASALISFLKLDNIESYFYDLRVSLKAAVGLSGLTKTDIVIVKIDSKTVEHFQGFPNYQNHSDFLNKLITDLPRFVIMIFALRTANLKISTVTLFKENLSMMSQANSEIFIYLPMN